MNRKLVVVLAALAAVAIAAGIGASAKQAPAAHQSTYKMVLSNSFAGNDWRVELQAIAAASIKYPPFKGRIDYKLALAPSPAPTAQINSMNDIILSHPDAIIMDAASPTALNQVIARACAQGIVVVAVDSPVTAPCAYKLGANWYRVGVVFAEWMAKTMGFKGEVLMDRGLPGVKISADVIKGMQNVLKKYPKIKIVGWYVGQYALGPEQEGVQNLLTAHPNVTGILASYGAGALKAVLAAKKDPSKIAIIGSAYNISNVMCLQKKALCINVSNAPTLAADGMKLAMDVIGGKKVPKQQYTKTPFYVSNPVTVPGNDFRQIKVGVSALPNQPPGLFLPYKPAFMPQLTLQDALGK